MEQIKYFFDVLVHLDKYLILITDEYGLLIFFIIFAVIFCETGLVFTPFLPGDSLVFAIGALAASGVLDLLSLFIVLCFAAIAGDTVNYQIGNMMKNKVAARKNIPFLKREHLNRTEQFFKKHGGKTIIIARFIPIIRTFAPFVAGVGTMPYKNFINYNIIGAISWVTLFLFGGYFFGNLPFVKSNFNFVILGIILISLVPGIVTYFKANTV